MDAVKPVPDDMGWGCGYTPEPYPVAVRLVDEGGRDRDVCDPDDHPNMTDLIRAARAADSEGGGDAVR